jgi:hypothetical protein
MFINKIGYSHWEVGKNNHDYGFEQGNIKCVVDGCSEGLHSEVGAKLYCHLFKNSNGTLTEQKIFQKFEDIIDTGLETNDKEWAKTILNYFLFTILTLIDRVNLWEVRTCGDGVIIKQTWDDKFEYDIIEQNGKPKYYAYNFVPKIYLTDYQDGVDFDIKIFFKQDYKAVGIASDGLQYILNSEFKDEFEEYLRDRKEVKINRLINREHKYFKDDITIVI